MENIKKDQIIACKSKEDLIKLLNDHHINGKAKEFNQEHVVIVYADGEICSTKAGDLFCSRNMHQLEPGILRKKDRVTGLLWQQSGYEAVTLKNVATKLLHNKIKDLFRSNEEEKLDLKTEYDDIDKILRPLKVGSSWQMDDAPEIMGMHFWNAGEEWKEGHESGRQWRIVRYETSNSNIALEVQLGGFGIISEVKDIEYNEPKRRFIIDTIELY